MEPIDKFKNENDSDNIIKFSLKKNLKQLGYHLGKRIGEGSYSKVYFAEHIVTNNSYPTTITISTTSTIPPLPPPSLKPFSNKPIACKIIDSRQTSIEFITKFLPRELEIVQLLNHPNIITVHSILKTGPFICFFMDFCHNGDLLDGIRTNGPIKPEKIHLFFRQICFAIEYLHNREISHRDIKCENILIFNKNCVKLTDFSFARSMKSQINSDINFDDEFNDRSSTTLLSKTYCGSISYSAPELLLRIPYNPKFIDTWSIGCVLFIMATAKMPFNEENVKVMIKKQLIRDYKFPKSAIVSENIRRLISSLLEPELTKRFTIKEVLNDPWVKSGSNS